MKASQPFPRLINAYAVLIVSLGLAACVSPPPSGSPSPQAEPRSTVPAPRTGPPSVSAPSASTIDPIVADKSLEKILSDYTQKWRQDYPLRLSLARKCPTSKSYNYGMRMLQPATFQGEFSDAVQRRYGKTTDFIVIAVAANSAAAKAQIAQGDRITRIGTVSSTQTNAGPKLAEQSRRWSNPYDVVLVKDGRETTVKLTPDLVCDVPL